MINSVLTRPNSFEELYRAYFSFANTCEFTSLLRNYIQNEEWKDTSQEMVWELLSKISDDIGAVLTDDIVNYTRNCVDINTCRIPQLVQHGKQIAYNLEYILKSFDIMPLPIKMLVDVFSINREYLFGNGQNHILSDDAIHEILNYIQNSNIVNKVNGDLVEKLISDPHSLLNQDLYTKFVRSVFAETLTNALKLEYGDGKSIIENVLYDEIANKERVLLCTGYKSWVDKFIWNEIEHPLNGSCWTTQIHPDKIILKNTIFDEVQSIKQAKSISPRFNPFKIADHIYFNGLNPTNGLSDDQMSLVNMVLEYHSGERYDYATNNFIKPPPGKTTRYSYYRELEFFNYLKLMMFAMNNLRNFSLGVINNYSYSPDANSFCTEFNYSSTENEQNSNIIGIINMFDDGTDFVISSKTGEIIVNMDIVWKVSDFLTQYSFNILSIRENMKTIAQKHAMRGTGALLSHVINDYLIKELPIVRNMISDSTSLDNKLLFGWEVEPNNFNNYCNVSILEYEDDNEYFNIDPENDTKFTFNTNQRYWENLAYIDFDDSLGVLTKRQINNFYRNTLGMGVLQRNKHDGFDDIEDFLIDLFKIGANPIKIDSNGVLNNPIDDVIQKSELEYGYTKQERIQVQQNIQLRNNQKEQFIQYSGMTNLLDLEPRDMDMNRVFYWKNLTYSSHMLHPFMYNLKLWNRMNNIIINGYKDYSDGDMVDLMLKKITFDQLFGQYGECRNFWKYNIRDLSGYTTRYEAAIKNEHKQGTSIPSPLTGYDGLFYPDAARDFLDLYQSTSDFNIPSGMFINPYLAKDGLAKVDTQTTKLKWNDDISDFMRGIYSIYWQLTTVDDEDTFYSKWYSHLNYPSSEYQRIAIQLWYWRDRILDMITTEKRIDKYFLDQQGNSLILVDLYSKLDEQSNPLLIDLAIKQASIQYSGNRNSHVQWCEDELVHPTELWIRWKSNPIAIPAFDPKYMNGTGDFIIDSKYGVGNGFGQIQMSHSGINKAFGYMIDKWGDKYGASIGLDVFPVVFDVQMSANILMMSTIYVPNDDEYSTLCARKPYHTISLIQASQYPSEYNWIDYLGVDTLNKVEMLFDRYHYCSSNGSILIPFYEFDCSDDKEDFHQIIHILEYVIPVQTVKTINNVSPGKLIKVAEYDVDLNEMVLNIDGKLKPRFDRLVKVARNTHVVFSPYESDRKTKVKLAFLGCYIDEKDEYSRFKMSSCGAKTRYEIDSYSPRQLSLLKDRMYRKYGEWKYEDDESSWLESNMSQDDIFNDSFNSYDSLDKHVLVISQENTIDDSLMFSTKIQQIITTSDCNILGDAGYIPHFAYQSVIRYSDKNAGIANTFLNQYFDSKDHLSFELLGLDNKKIPDRFNIMSKMVVQDLVDGCDTILSPAKMMQDIFRIWCQTDGVDKYHFDNEYKEYVNLNDIDFDQDGIAEWRPCSSDGDLGFEIEIPNQSIDFDEWSKLDNADQIKYESNILSKLVDEYYVQVLRTEDGQIQNEKRYILQPTKVSEFISGMHGIDQSGMELQLDKWELPMSSGDQMNSTQTLFVGTQNPFTYDNNTGKRVKSPNELAQYGNGICGVESIRLRIDVHVNTETHRRYLVPTIKFMKVNSDGDSIEDMMQNAQTGVSSGKVTLIFSHRNLDNIAKYHMLNWTSNLYIGGSLPKDGTNRFMHSDFKNTKSIKLFEDDSGHWTSVDENGKPTDELKFFIEQVGVDTTSQLTGMPTPPYYFIDDNNQKWYLEQSGLNQSGKVVAKKNNQGVFAQYDIPQAGNFTYAHLTLDRPLSYLDYLYVKRGTIQFKINEESFSMFDPMSIVPPFYIDEVLKNKLDDLYDIELIRDYSTFVHQSEDPSDLMLCPRMNPLVAEVVLDQGLERVEQTDGAIGANTELESECAIRFDNGGHTILDLQLEETELDDCLKIYTNYVKVDDGDGDFHFDLYFNIQNLFNSPFEYISSITNQANVLILKDSYLYLSGDKYKKVVGKDGKVHNEIDTNKVDSIQEGGILSIYGQVKSYSGEILNSTSTIRLFQYRIYNISDDKPKFMIKKIYDITKDESENRTNYNRVVLDFKDVLWTIDESNMRPDPSKEIVCTSDFEKEIVCEDLSNKNDEIMCDKSSQSIVCSSPDSNKIVYSSHRLGGDIVCQRTDFDMLSNDIVIIQPLKVYHEWQHDADWGIGQIQFDIVNDVIDFGVVPELCSEDEHRHTLIDDDGNPHYDRWSDDHMRIDVDPLTGIPRMTLKYKNDGFNFETIYLKWRLPAGFRIMDTIDRLRGYMFSSTAKNVLVGGINDNNANISWQNAILNIHSGHVVGRVKDIGEMYLGLEHSTTQRLNGFVLQGFKSALGAAIQNAIKESELIKQTKINNGGNNGENN